MILKFCFFNKIRNINKYSDYKENKTKCLYINKEQKYVNFNIK